MGMDLTIWGVAPAHDPGQRQRNLVTNLCDLFGITRQDVNGALQVALTGDDTYWLAVMDEVLPVPGLNPFLADFGECFDRPALVHDTGRDMYVPYATVPMTPEQRLRYMVNP